MPRRLAQQRVTLSDLEWPFHGSSTLKSASRAISAVAELLVWLMVTIFCNDVQSKYFDSEVMVTAFQSTENHELQ